MNASASVLAADRSELGFYASIRPVDAPLIDACAAHNLWERNMQRARLKARRATTTRLLIRARVMYIDSGE
jgi:hypothetical protein